MKELIKDANNKIQGIKKNDDGNFIHSDMTME